jgi:putative nucleotidyltransferase with HDIG domain
MTNKIINIEQTDKQTLIGLIPELNLLKGYIENNAWHDKDDDFTHTFTVFNNLKENLKLSFIKNNVSKSQITKYLKNRVDKLTKKQILLWAGLLHDIGKPRTFKNKEGIISCPNHEIVSVDLAKKIIMRLEFSKQDTQRVYSIIYNHSIPHLMLDIKDNEKLNTAIKKIRNKYSDLFIELMLLGLSDTESSQLKYLDHEEYSFRIEKYNQILNEA